MLTQIKLEHWVRKETKAASQFHGGEYCDSHQKPLF